MSIYTEIRRLRSSGYSLKAIYDFLKAGGYCDEKGASYTHRKVKEASLSLEEKIHHLNTKGLKLREIVEALRLEGYTTRRGGAPTIGCVWYVLNREIALQRKARARRLSS